MVPHPSRGLAAGCDVDFEMATKSQASQMRGHERLPVNKETSSRCPVAYKAL